MGGGLWLVGGGWVVVGVLCDVNDVYSIVCNVYTYTYYKSSINLHITSSKRGKTSLSIYTYNHSKHILKTFISENSCSLIKNGLSFVNSLMTY